jgi:hypothetical protein
MSFIVEFRISYSLIIILVFQVIRRGKRQVEHPMRTFHYALPIGYSIPSTGKPEVILRHNGETMDRNPFLTNERFKAEFPSLVITKVKQVVQQSGSGHNQNLPHSGSSASLNTVDTSDNSSIGGTGTSPRNGNVNQQQLPLIHTQEQKYELDSVGLYSLTVAAVWFPIFQFMHFLFLEDLRHNDIKSNNIFLPRAKSQAFFEMLSQAKQLNGQSQGSSMITAAGLGTGSQPLTLSHADFQEKLRGIADSSLPFDFGLLGNKDTTYLASVSPPCDLYKDNERWQKKLLFTDSKQMESGFTDQFSILQLLLEFLTGEDFFGYGYHLQTLYQVG